MTFLIRDYLLAIPMVFRYEFESPCTRRIREILEINLGQRARWPYWRLFYYSYCILMGIRLLALYLLMQPTVPSEYYETVAKYDTVVNTLNRDYAHNPIIGLCLAPTMGFAIFLDYIMFVKPNRLLWSHVYEVWEVNGRAFVELNPKLYVDPDFRYNPWRTTINYYQYFVNLYKCKKARFASRLSHVPYLNVQIRTRAILAKQLLERLDYLFQYGNAIFNVISYFSLGFHIWKNYSGLVMLIGLVDAACIVYVMLRSFFIAMFSLVIIVYIGLLFINYLASLNRLLQEAIEQRQLLSQGQIANRLMHFMSAHHVLRMDIITINRRVVSDYLLAGMASNFIWNIYLISVFTLSDLALDVKFQAFTWFLLQMLLFVLGMQPLIYLVERFHSADRLLFALQPCFRAQATCYKVKLLAYYEVLHTNNKLHFTLGQFGVVSKRTIFEFLFFHSGYLIYSFKIFLTTKTFQ